MKPPLGESWLQSSLVSHCGSVVVVVVEPPGIDVVLVVGPPEHAQATHVPPAVQSAFVSHCSSGLSTVSPQTPGTIGANCMKAFLRRMERATKRPSSTVPLPMIIFAFGAQAYSEIWPLREKRACEPWTNQWIAPGNGSVASDVSGPSRVALLTRELPDTVTVDAPPKRMLPFRPTRTLQKR